jgi:hypothetical protein
MKPVEQFHAATPSGITSVNGETTLRTFPNHGAKGGGPTESRRRVHRGFIDKRPIGETRHRPASFRDASVPSAGKPDSEFTSLRVDERDDTNCM